MIKMAVGTQFANMDLAWDFALLQVNLCDSLPNGCCIPMSPYCLSRFCFQHQFP